MPSALPSAGLSGSALQREIMTPARSFTGDPDDAPQPRQGRPSMAPRRDAPRRPDVRPSSQKMAGIHAQIQDTLERFSRPGDALYVSDDPVTIHAERLVRRGLEEGAAWRQARWMANDSEHRARCEVCRAGEFTPGEAADTTVGPLESTEAFE